MTPHINAVPGAIAKFVLMPGDPLRAKFMAEKFLTNVQMVSNVRNMLMFTGEYHGVRVSICGSGMGQPSMGIYAYELFKFYNVETIIRVGTAGAYDPRLNLYDVVVATAAYSDSTVFSKALLGRATHLSYPGTALVKALQQAAARQGKPLFAGRVHSSDVFYSATPLATRVATSRAVAVEMEAAALFATAAFFNKQAACLLTISDSLVTHGATTALERQTAFTSMVELALSIAQ